MVIGSIHFGLMYTTSALGHTGDTNVSKYSDDHSIGLIMYIFLFKSRLTTEFTGKLVIPLGNGEIASGIMMKMSAGSERGHLAKFTYGYDDPMAVQENPTRKKLRFDLHPIDPKREQEELFYARYDIVACFICFSIYYNQATTLF